MSRSEAISEHSAAHRTLWLCFLICLCEGIDLQAAGVAAGGIHAEFHADAAYFGYFFSASTLGLFVGALFGGRLSDRIGRRSVLLASVCAFGLFSLLTPLAWDLGSLTWARLFTGLGLGGADGQHGDVAGRLQVGIRHGPLEGRAAMAASRHFPVHTNLSYK